MWDAFRPAFVSSMKEGVPNWDHAGFISFPGGLRHQTPQNSRLSAFGLPAQAICKGIRVWIRKVSSSDTFFTTNYRCEVRLKPICQLLSSL